MSGLSPYRMPRIPTRLVWNSPSRSPALMLTEIRNHADRGAIVSVLRVGGSSFQIIRNGARYFVRSADGDPLATVDTVLEAMMAGDAWLDRPPPEDDPSDFLPRGAA